MDKKYNVLERFSGKRISMIPIGTNYLASNIKQEEAVQKMIERSDEWYKKFLEHYDEKEIKLVYTDKRRYICVEGMSNVEIELQEYIPINLDEIPDMNHFDPKSGLRPEPWEKGQRFFD